MNTNIDIARLTKELQKAHISLLSNDETRFYASAIMVGTSVIDLNTPTACTDGVDTWYGAKFMSELSQPEKVGLVMHENLHKILRHSMRYQHLYKDDAQIAAASVDYVVNDIIVNIKGYGGWINLPEGRLYDAKFHKWSVSEVYKYLKQGKTPDGEQEQRTDTGDKSGDEGNEPSDGDEGNEPSGGGESNEPSSGGSSSVAIGGKEYALDGLDEHKERVFTDEQKDKLEQDLNEAVQQANALAGVLGLDMPRAFVEAARPVVNWKEETAQFFSEFTKGHEEYSWRRYDRRRMANDELMPSRYNERIEELVLAIDASGSMDGPLFDTACNAAVDAIEQIDPECVRVIFWEEHVCSDQEFRDDYAGVRAALKPSGGGGTRAACVVEHMKAKGYDPACVVMITDGYLETNVVWETDIPTLWLVLQSERFVPPRGRLVRVNK